MNIGRYFVVGWIVAGLQMVSAQSSSAQDPTPQATQNPPAESSDNPSLGTTAPAGELSPLAGVVAGLRGSQAVEDTSGGLPQIPALLGGRGVSMAFGSEMERSSYLRGGLNVGATYDSNPLLLTNAESNTSETIFPNLTILESTSRTRWSLGYAGGLTVNQKLTSQNQGSHSLNFDSQYRLSPHLNLRVAENFSMTTGFFDAGTGEEVVAGSGGPNASLLSPLSTQMSSMTTVETNYHFALNDLIGASGSFYDLHFTNVPAGTLLSDSQTASASTFWLHRLSHDDWAGISYRFDRITFDPSGETTVHSVFFVDTMSLTNRFTLSGFIGPQYSENQGITPLSSQVTETEKWSVGGGAEVGWKDEHDSASVGYSRLISDGSGVLGSVLLQTFHGAFRRQLTPEWAVAFMASHGTNQALILPSVATASSVNLTSAGVSVERNVSKSLGLRAGYTHDFQQQFGVPGQTQNSPLQTLDASRNRFFVTLSYQWSKPLGM